MSAFEFLMRRRAMMSSDNGINYFYLKSMEDGNTLQLVKNNGEPPAANLEYSINNVEWLPYTIGDTLNLDNGDTVRWRRKEGYSSSFLSSAQYNTSPYYSFIPSKSYIGGGNITTLLDYEGVITELGIGCFRYLFNSNLFSINLSIPSTVTSLKDSCLRDCNGFVGDLIIPDGISSLGQYCFCSCKRLDGKLTIPDSVIYFYFGCFWDLHKIKGPITIPSNAIDIKANAFASLYLVDTIVSKNTTPPSLNSSAFSGTPLQKVYVPYSSDHSILAAYQSASGWSNYANIMYELDENGNIPQ